MNESLRRTHRLAEAGPDTGGSRPRFGNVRDESLRAPHVSTSARPRRRPTLLQLQQLLSERDWEILASLARVRLLTSRQFQRLYFADGSPLTQARRTQRVMQRLFDWGLVARLERRIGGHHAGSAGYIYRLTPKGLRLHGLVNPQGGERRTLPEPSIRFQDHVLAVSELYVRLQEAEQLREPGRLDPSIRLVQFEAEPASWRSYAGLGGARLQLRPDAFVVLAVQDEHTYEQLSFVEVDLGTETLPHIRRKGQAYLQYLATGEAQQLYGVFPNVVFLVTNHRRARTIWQRLAKLPTPPTAKSWFSVGLLAGAVPLLAGHVVAGEDTSSQVREPP